MLSDQIMTTSDMLSIKKNVLKLGNWMVTWKQLLEPKQNQIIQNQTQQLSQNIAYRKNFGQ